MIQSKQDLKFYIAEDRKRNLRADSNMSKFQYFLRKIYGNENLLSLTLNVRDLENKNNSDIIWKKDKIEKLFKHNPRVIVIGATSEFDKYIQASAISFFVLSLEDKNCSIFFSDL